MSSHVFNLKLNMKTKYSSKIFEFYFSSKSKHSSIKIQKYLKITLIYIKFITTNKRFSFNTLYNFGLHKIRVIASTRVVWT